jgi:hypothetical protein
VNVNGALDVSRPFSGGSNEAAFIVLSLNPGFRSDVTVKTDRHSAALSFREAGAGLSDPSKKAPGEGTGPTIHADFRATLVGRVPSRGDRDVFEQAVNGTRLRLFG